MDKKVPLNKSRILVLVGIANLLVMVLILIAATHVNINIKTNTGSIIAMAATFFDIALAYLSRLINQFSVVFIIINTTISGCLVLIAAVISRSHKPARVVKRLNFSTENR